MRRSSCSVLLAMGSYACVGPVLAAKLAKIPVVLHEANVLPGRAIRFLSKYADSIAISFDETRFELTNANIKRIIFTGTPIRKEEQTGTDRDFSALSPDIFTILIMGGSRGAHSLNNLGSQAVITAFKQVNKLQVIHLAGLADEERVREAYHKAGVTHLVFGFLQHPGQAYKRADLAICRSGASTCAELSFYGVSSLLVPYPWAKDQHQTANARAMQKAGAADVREQSQLTVSSLANYIKAHIHAPDLLDKMRNAAKRRITDDAAKLLADIVINTAKTK